MAIKRKPYRDPKTGKFAKRPAPKPKRRVKAKPKPRTDIRKSLQRKMLPAGTEFELTATTKGGSPSGDKRAADPRRLHLKIRVTLTRSMTPETARSLLHDAVRSPRTVSGIEFQGIDWSKGEKDGTSDDIEKFYGAITNGRTRFERVS